MCVFASQGMRPNCRRTRCAAEHVATSMAASMRPRPAGTSSTERTAVSFLDSSSSAWRGVGATPGHTTANWSWSSIPAAPACGQRGAERISGAAQEASWRVGQCASVSPYPPLPFSPPLLLPLRPQPTLAPYPTSNNRQGHSLGVAPCCPPLFPPSPLCSGSPCRRPASRPVPTPQRSTLSC